MARCVKDINEHKAKIKALEEKERMEKENSDYPSKEIPPRDWHKYNLAKTQEKRLFMRLLYELCQVIPEPPHDNGRPPIPIRDLVFSAGLKLYSNVSGRIICSDLEQAKLAGYISKAPHFNTLSDFFKCTATKELLEKLLTITALPLKHLEDSYSMDSSGFGTYQHFQYRQIRYGLYEEKLEKGWKIFLKGHVCIGTRTNAIISAVVTPENGADIAQAPRLLQVLGDNFNAQEVSADKAYTSNKVFQLIQSIGAMPFIPFKSNSKSSKYSSGIWNEMYKYFSENKVLFLQHYHKRSNVECVFMMVKKRLGEHLRNKTFETQSNELFMKFICHNICCLVTEIFENEVHIDFKKCLNEYIDRKEKEQPKVDMSKEPEK